MKRWLVLGALFLGACTHEPSAYELHGRRGALKARGTYLIHPGDTLFGIAWRYGLDVDELARWNEIQDPDHILAGSVIRLEPPYGVQRLPVNPPQVQAGAARGWQWPAHGTVIHAFSNDPGHHGIKIAGYRGQPVFAASSGQVAYSGSIFSGYGRMIIIRHEGRVLSAYGYLDRVFVHEKQYVRKGQRIATMGLGPDNRTPTLLFETRKVGQPVNPYGFIGSSQR